MGSIEKFVDKLNRGRLCIGPGITLADPLVTEALADEVDFLWYDLEHCPMNPETLNAHFLAARGRNKPAVVRIPFLQEGIIKQILDSGGNGIVVPQIRTREEVEKVVSYCYYPPKGQRGFGPRIPSDYGRIDGNVVMKNANENMFVGVMIETIEALNDIEEIVDVEGLFSVVIGPSDLSISMGIPNELKNPALVSAVKKIVKAANSVNVFVGAGLGTDKDYAKFLADLGVQWLQLGGDIGYLIHGIREFKT